MMFGALVGGGPLLSIVIILLSCVFRVAEERTVEETKQS